MEWRDEGILLWVRRHGESNVIVEALTAEHGRHSGLIRGGGGRSHAGILQPGTQLSLEWRARLAEHLGAYKADMIKSRAASIMNDRLRLAALNSVSALLVQFLPEREPNAEIYATTLGVLDAMSDGDLAWPIHYATWELNLLGTLGFGLDLDSCASTGQTEDLVFVSPRSGRAVCREAGGPFADRMLPLPGFLRGEGTPQIGDVREALRLTGYFLEHWVGEAYDLEELPEARQRFIQVLERVDMPLRKPPEPVPWGDEEDDEWLTQVTGRPRP